MAAISDMEHFAEASDIENTAMVLIDHRIGTWGWAHLIDASIPEKNVKVLATFASAVKMPLVLTSSMETNVQGLLLEVIPNAAPDAYSKRVKRQGIVNAWDDPSFAEAVRSTGSYLAQQLKHNYGALMKVVPGKKQLIVAGVTTDVCLVPPALSTQGEKFHIKVCNRGRSHPVKRKANCEGKYILDAGRNPRPLAEPISLQRLQQAGGACDIHECYHH